MIASSDNIVKFPDLLVGERLTLVSGDIVYMLTLVTHDATCIVWDGKTAADMHEAAAEWSDVVIRLEGVQ